MEPITILIVEDEAILSMDLTYRLTQMGYRVVATADNGPQALSLYRSQPVDLALLDIHILGEWDGIETARQMRQVRQAPLIFLTAMTDEATIQRARTVAPSAYITKPFNDLNLRISIDLAMHNFALQRIADKPGTPMGHSAGESAELSNGNETLMQSREYVFIKQNYRFVKFRLADVLYLQSEGNYTDIITATHKYTLRMVLNKVLEKLQTPAADGSGIARVHRSFAVNLRQIDSFTETEIFVGTHIIPIGRSYRDSFMNGFEFM